MSDVITNGWTQLPNGTRVRHADERPTSEPAPWAVQYRRVVTTPGPVYMQDRRLFGTPQSGGLTVRDFGPHGSPVRIHAELIRRIEELGQRLGGRVRVVRGWEAGSSLHDVARGGPPNEHRDGLGADVMVDGVRPAKVAEMALRLFPSVGLYRDAVHVGLSALQDWRDDSATHRERASFDAQAGARRMIPVSDLQPLPPDPVRLPATAPSRLPLIVGGVAVAAAVWWMAQPAATN
jgi:hypothetical protein